MFGAFLRTSSPRGSAKLLTQCGEEGIFLVYGAPKYLICDNGTQMRSKEFRKLCDDYQVTLSYTPLYYPRSDPTERVNATVKTMIATTVKHDHRRWVDNLAAIGCAIRTSRHETTGYTPISPTSGGNTNCWVVNSITRYQHPTTIQTRPPGNDSWASGNCTRTSRRN
jgi:hypothetical protein